MLFLKKGIYRVVNYWCPKANILQNIHRFALTHIFLLHSI